MSRYSQLTTPASRSAAPPMQPAPGMWRDMPTRALSVRSDVGVPLLWAVVSGLLVGVGLWYLSRDVDAALGIGGLVMLIVWPLGIWVVIRSLTAHEWPETQPAPQFPEMPAPAGEGTLVIGGERRRAEQRSVERDDRLARWWAFLAACEAGHTDVRYWQEQRDAAGGRLVSDSDYYRYRRLLMQSGDAAWDQPNNHAAGWHLTRYAAAIYQDTDYWAPEIE